MMCAAQVCLATVDDKVAPFGLELAQAEDDLAALVHTLSRQAHRQPLKVRAELIPRFRLAPERHFELRPPTLRVPLDRRLCAARREPTHSCALRRVADADFQQDGLRLNVREDLRVRSEERRVGKEWRS